MARHEHRTFGKIELAKERLSGEVSMEKVLIASGGASLKLTTAELVASASSIAADKTLNVEINGTVYKLLLKA